MSYAAYVTAEEYAAMFPGETAMTDSDLKKASRHIDSLTFNRIVGAGFDNLTEFQQDIIKEVVCRQALFEHENVDLIESVLSSYSINGVSMQFGDSWNVEIRDGVAMQRDLYTLLSQTGLCCRILM